MPEIYYRPLPQKLPAEYMARKEEIRSVALRSYTRYISDENFCFIRNHVERIPETDALRGILDALLARADVLKDAVLSGDYVAMRRYGRRKPVGFIEVGSGTARGLGASGAGAA